MSDISRQAVGPFSSHATAGSWQPATRSKARPANRPAEPSGAKLPGSPDATGKAPQFLRDTQSEPYGGSVRADSGRLWSLKVTRAVGGAPLRLSAGGRRA